MVTGIRKKNHKFIPKIPALKDPIILYMNNSEESQKAEAMLKEAGISPYVTTGRVEPLERKPLVLYGGGIYQGLNEIRSLIHLLAFWVTQPSCTLVFRDKEACKNHP
ncbi:MAG: hypothetical protein JRJ03_00405 [Deltaproteobacteria bacterium]|nr:hypothetical protein [Deltaproteobacteria bacterium]